MPTAEVMLSVERGKKKEKNKYGRIHGKYILRDRSRREKKKKKRGKKSLHINQCQREMHTRGEGL